MLHIFRKIFSSSRHKHGNSKKEANDDSPQHDRKSLKNPTYAVERVNKIPSIEDLQKQESNYNERSGNSKNSSRENVDQALQYIVEEHDHVTTDVDSPSQTKVKPDVDISKHGKIKQVAVVCPTYQNVSGFTRKNSETSSKPPNHTENPEPQYANAGDVTIATVQKSESTPENPHYQNIAIIKEKEDPPPENTNIYQNVISINPGSPPPKENLPVGNDADDDHDYEETITKRPKLPKKSVKVKHTRRSLTRKDLEIEIKNQVENTSKAPIPKKEDDKLTRPLKPGNDEDDDGEYEVALNLSPGNVTPVKAKPLRPPLPSEDLLRKTEYFKVKGDFKQARSGTASVNVIDVMRPFKKESPLFGKKKQGRIGSERHHYDVTMASTLRKASSMNDIADADDTDDYLTMKNKKIHDIYILSNSGNPRPGGQGNVNITEDDSDQSEDYLDMSDQTKDVPNCSQEQSDNCSDEQDDDYIPMTRDEDIFG